MTGRRSEFAAALLIAAFVAAPLGAQTVGAQAGTSGAAQDEAAITRVVDALFDGMRAGDSAAVRAVFHPEVRMVTSFRSREGQPQVAIEESMDGFIEAVGTPHDEVWDERVSDLVVMTDGDFGIAWMKYDFYLGDRFSHCGIDQMELVRTSEGWRIIGLADTRRRQGCAALEATGGAN